MSPSVLLREARKAAGMTQEQLADVLGKSQPEVARLERSGANPTWQTLQQALRATGHDVQLKRLEMASVETDLAQLRERMAMSPGDRLRTFQASQQSLERLRGRARQRDA